MKQKTFTQVVGVLLALKAVFGLYSLLGGGQVTIGRMVVPAWLTLVAVVVYAYLAYIAFSLTKK